MDRFLIAPLNKGLQNDLRPWLIPDEAYYVMQNAYLFRNRVRKRFGADLLRSSMAPAAGFEQLQSRLRINVATVDGSSNATGTVPGTVFGIGQMFSIGNNFYTVTSLGTPTNLLRSDGVGATAQYYTSGGSAGQFVIDATPAGPGATVYFYPSTPVMGLLTYESVGTPNQVEPTIAFDTQFAYSYGSSGWERLGTGIWTGSDSQFFWSTTYKGNASSDKIFYVVNNKPADGIQYWNGTVWATLTPSLDGTNSLYSSQMIITFKDRLLALNTWEGTSSGAAINYGNRCRFSANGSPLASNSWRQDIPGNGSFIDCPTSEAAISAEFIKDRLIVFFQRSTWELAYTGNQVLPFVWQKINTEFGAESTFSVVPHDKIAYSIDSVGILACNGANVERIDQIIPEEIFQFSNDNNGPLRTYGIRDYEMELVYWTYSALPPHGITTESKYPNKIMVYNYRTNSWAIFDDSITCFGYFQSTQGLTWGSATMLWEAADFVWNAGAYQPLERNIIAGNQQGYTFIVRPDNPRNAPSMQITNITITAGGATATISCINNNLEPGSFVLIESCIGVTGFNGNIFNVDSVATDFSSFVISATTPTGFTGSYLGGGVVTLVSRIDIQTKQYNFYTSQGKNCAINKVDFLVDRTETGEITIDYYTSSAEISLVTAGEGNNSILGTNVLETTPYTLYPYEQSQIRLWHSVYFQADGECIQFRIYLSDTEMANPLIALEDFQLHAFCVYATASASRFQ